MRKASPWLVLLIATTSVSCLAQSNHDVIVTTDTPPSQAADISSVLFSHNIRWMLDGDTFWDNRENENPFYAGMGRVKPGALDVIQAATPSGPSLLRYPGGGHGDTCRWRDGVGRFKPVAENKRRKHSVYTDKIPKFGTDEAVAFAREVSDNMKPLMQANWWDWNRANTRVYGISATEWSFWHEFCSRD